MHCNGKCQLMKKLQQEEKKEQQAPERKNENKNETHIFNKSNFLENEPSLLKNSLSYSLFVPEKIKDQTQKVFRPPIM